MKRILSLFLVLILLFSLTGCINNNELDALSIVTGFILTKGETKPLRLYVEILGQGPEGGTHAPIVISAEGDTMFSCLAALTPPTGKSLYFSHCKAGIIEENALNTALPSLLDWSMRSNEARLSMLLFSMQGENPEELFSAIGKSTDSFFLSLASSVDTHKLAAMTVSKLIETRASKGAICHLPILLPTGPALFSGHAEAPALLFLDENRPIGTITVEEAPLYGIISGESIPYSANFPSEKGPFSIWLKKPKISRKAEIDSFDLTLSFHAEVADLSFPFDPYQEEDRKSIETTAARVLNERLSTFFETTRAKFHRDIFGLSTAVYRDNPDLWKQHNQNFTTNFSAYTFRSSVNIHLSDTGLSGGTTGISKEATA